MNDASQTFYDFGNYFIYMNYLKIHTIANWATYLELG